MHEDFARNLRLHRPDARIYLLTEPAYAGLAPQELLATGPFPDIDGWDPVEPDPAALKARVGIS
mgnify:CR=1 FL=1